MSPPKRAGVTVSGGGAAFAAPRWRRPARAACWSVSLLAGLAAAMVPRPASAYVRSRTASGDPYRWANPCISLEVHLSDLPGVTEANMRAAAEGAARAWTVEASSCTRIQLALSFASDAAPATRDDGRNVLGTRRDGWCQTASSSAAPTSGTCNPPSAIAATSVFAIATDGRITGADTQLNTVNFSWGIVDDQSGPTDLQDLQTVLTHEIGHVLGLEHPCWGGSGARGIDDNGQPVPDCYGASEELQQDTMFPSMETSGPLRRIVSAGPARAMCEIYPALPSAQDAPLPPVGVLAACPRSEDAARGGCAIAGGPSRHHDGVIATLLSLAGFIATATRRRASARARAKARAPHDDPSVPASSPPLQRCFS